MLELRVDKVDGPALARVEIPRCDAWTIVNSRVSGVHAGVHNLIVRLPDDAEVEIDWIRFE